MKKIFLFLMAFSFAFAVNAQKMDAAAAKQLVFKNSEKIGLFEKDQSGFFVSNAYSNEGTQMVYLNQEYKGLRVFNEIRVLAFKNGSLFSDAGAFIAGIENISKNASAAPSVNMNEAVINAFQEAQVKMIPSFSSPLLKEDGRRKTFGTVPGVTEEVTAELIWSPLRNSAGNITDIKLAWQVQVVPAHSDDWWLIHVDAASGAIINKVNLTVYEGHVKNEGLSISNKNLQSRRNAATGLQAPAAGENAASPTLVNNASYLVIPYPAESPTHPGGTAAIRNNPWTFAPGNATTLNWHSDGTVDYNITRGNNVWATEDRAATNQNTGLPATSSTSPDPLNFNFPPNYNVAPTTPAFQQFAVTNLFYWNNVTHDIAYNYGFNEISANFQKNNLGRGGNQGDDVKALAQSGAGTNNANFATGPDGNRPQMRMYLFDAVANTILHVNTPPVLVGDYTNVESGFSTANKLAAVGPVTGQVIWFDDASGTAHEACTGAPVTSLTGKIALINRGTCSFVIKALAAQNAGAIAVIMINNVPGAPIVMGGTDNTITIPAVMITQADGALFAAQITNNLNVTLSGTAGQNIDGDLDNGIIVHEYGHGISNRFTGGGGAGCLSNAEQGGEGWSDYLGLMLGTNWASTPLTAGPVARGIGTYVLGQSSTGPGIRTKPYSTNLAVNPLTYADMGTGTIGTEVHNIGEIWCMALWEMTWALIQQENSINPDLYNYTPAGVGGNSIALKLVLEGMRLQNCSPGYIDARNAIMAADRNLYAGRHACAIWTAFAKRGMGFGASQGSAFSATDQTASTAMPPAPTITTQPVDVTVAVGANATFTANAGSDINLIYQWQVSTDGGVSWTNVSPSVITPSLTINNVTAGMAGYKYRAQIFIGCAITTSAVATLNILSSNPVITSQPANTTVCAGNNATFNVTASGTGLTYQWQVSTNGGTIFTAIGGATTATLTLTAVTAGMNNNQYRVIVTNASGATTSAAAILTVTTPPAAPVVTTPVTYCQGATAVPLTATGSNLLWYTVATGGTGSSTAPTPSTATVGSTTYYVSQTVGCESPRAAITVNVNATPAAPTVTSPVNYCQGAAAVPLTATGTNLMWYTVPTGGTGSTTAPTPSTATIGTTTYYVSSTTGTCEGPRASIVVNITASTPAPGVTSPVTYCQGATAVPLTATGTNLIWYTVSTGGTGSTTAPTPSTATVGSTIYYVSQTTSCGEGPRASITVNVTAPPAAPTVTSPVTYCQGATAVPLTATGSNLMWYTVATGGTGSTTAPTPSTATVGSTTYYVSQTVGCESPRAAITVTVNSTPGAPGVTSPVTYCQGATAVPLTATGTNLKWYTVPTGGTSSTTSPTPSTATVGSTTYYVSQTSGTCEGPRASIVVNVTAGTAAPTVTSPVNYCQGATATPLTATGTNLLYYTVPTGGTGSSTAPTPSTATVGSITYYVSQTASPCGEGPRASITVTVSALPAAPVVSSPVTYCQGATATPITATGTGLLFYTTPSGGTGSSTAPTPSTTTVGSTTYYVSQTAGTCEGPRAAITVNVTATPAAPVVTTPVSYCQGATAVPLAATGTNLKYYTVATGGTGSTTAPTPSTATIGTTLYYVSQTTGTCEGPRATITVNITAGASITAQPTDITSCSTSATFTVTASGSGLTYQWQVSTDGGATYTNIPGATSAVLTLNNLTAATATNKYRVIVSAASCGSVTSNAVTAKVGTPPVVVLTAAPFTAYNPSVTGGLYTTVSPVGNYTYQWMRDGVILPNVTGPSFTAATGLLFDFGTYQVTVTDVTTGCSAVSNSIAITDIAGSRNELFISPNPTQGMVRVTYYSPVTTAQARKLTVYNSDGQRIMIKDFTVTGRYGSMNLDLTKLSIGTYMIVLMDASGKQIASDRVVKF